MRKDDSYTWSISVCINPLKKFEEYVGLNWALHVQQNIHSQSLSHTYQCSWQCQWGWMWTGWTPGPRWWGSQAWPPASQEAAALIHCGIPHLIQQPGEQHNWWSTIRPHLPEKWQAYIDIIPYSGYYSWGLIFAIFVVDKHPQKLNPRITRLLHIV